MDPKEAEKMVNSFARLVALKRGVWKMKRAVTDGATGNNVPGARVADRPNCWWPVVIGQRQLDEYYGGPEKGCFQTMAIKIAGGPIASPEGRLI